MHENEGKSFFCPMDKKIITLHIMYWKMSIPKVYTLPCSYLEFWDTLFSNISAQTVPFNH